MMKDLVVWLNPWRTPVSGVSDWRDWEPPPRKQGSNVMVLEVGRHHSLGNRGIINPGTTSPFSKEWRPFVSLFVPFLASTPVHSFCG